MTREPVDRKLHRRRAHHLLHPGGRAHADGVGDVDLVAAQVAHAAHHVHHVVDGHLALIRAAQRARDAAAQPHAGFLGGSRHRLEAGDGLGDRAVDVLLRERLAGRAEDHHLVGPGRHGALEAAQVRRQGRIQRAGAALDARHDLGAVRHLRHPLGRDERRGFDIDEARVGELVDQCHLDVGGHHRFLVLEPVARAHFDDLHVLGHGHGCLLASLSVRAARLSSRAAGPPRRQSACPRPARGSCRRSGRCCPRAASARRYAA
ncbi:hypothetical protein D3C87_1327590 [compost metagenome]